MKKPDRLFQVNRARRRENQGPKPQGPLGRLGTEGRYATFLGTP